MSTSVRDTVRLQALNPATGEVLGEFPCVSREEVAAAVARARAAQANWAARPLRERIAAIRDFMRVLHARKDDVAALITREAGKPLVESLASEVLVTLDGAKFLVDNALSLLKDQRVAHGSPIMRLKSGHLLNEPWGVVGIIAPWNYPLSTPAPQVLGALVVGNAVVLKPSEFTPLVGLEIKQLLDEAGFPPDLMQVVIGDGATGAALVESGVDKLIFTGSVATGKRVAQAAAARLLPVVLELGGKDPMLVLDDADLDIAAAGAVWGAFTNAGQVCLSVERCYVHRSVHDRFVQLCLERTKALRVGNGADPETDVGPMIHERQLATVEAHVNDARDRGAHVLCGGKRLAELGPNFFAPTLVAGADHSMRLMREETFGPVLPIMAFDTDDEAVALANDSEFGLSASVWTRNRARGEAIARRLQAGTVMVNDVIACFGIAEAPHGGVKNSGLGRTHGRVGLMELVRPKYVASDRFPSLARPWWYGYSAGFSRAMAGFVDALFGSSTASRIRGAIRSMPLLRRYRR